MQRSDTLHACTGLGVAVLVPRWRRIALADAALAACFAAGGQLQVLRARHGQARRGWPVSPRRGRTRLPHRRPCGSRAVARSRGSSNGQATDDVLQDKPAAVSARRKQVAAPRQNRNKKCAAADAAFLGQLLPCQLVVAPSSNGPRRRDVYCDLRDRLPRMSMRESNKRPSSAYRWPRERLAHAVLLGVPGLQL